MSKSIEDQVHQAFVSLIVRFEEWIAGRSPNDDATFVKVTEGMSPGLTYVFPGGIRAEGKAFFGSLREAWGTNPSFQLRTARDTTRLLWHDDQAVLAEIVELQRGATTVARPQHARRTTLFYLWDDDAPYRLRLQRIHETFVATDEEETLAWSLFDA